VGYIWKDEHDCAKTVSASNDTFMIFGVDGCMVSLLLCQARSFVVIRKDLTESPEYRCKYYDGNMV